MTILVAKPNPNVNSWCDHSAWMQLCVFCGAVLAVHDDEEFVITTETGTDASVEYLELRQEK